MAEALHGYDHTLRINLPPLGAVFFIPCLLEYCECAIQAGSPQPLGATWTGSGVNFAVFSSHATRIEVCIFDAAGGAESARYELPGGRETFGTACCRRAARKSGTQYAFCVYGPNEPQNGHRFDPKAALLDPYAHLCPPRCRCGRG